MFSTVVKNEASSVSTVVHILLTIMETKVTIHSDDQCIKEETLIGLYHRMIMMKSPNERKMI